MNLTTNDHLLDPRNLLIMIVGPTAVGKTEIAIQLAQRLNGEIISADSRLFYRGMDIGTAKPSLKDRSLVPHHLIDIADPDEIVSLADFQRMARETVEKIQAKNKLPIAVGGTGQYFRAITQNWAPPEVESNAQLRGELERQKEEHGVNWLHDKLRALDPISANKIDPRNYRRTIRALEVIMTTGEKFSLQRSQGHPPYQIITIGLTRPRSELYQRVDERIESMFDAGFLEEVRTLLDNGYLPNLPTLSAIGYRECVAILEGRLTLDEAKQLIRRATRMFVRRQANWFKESDPNIRWFRVEESVVDAIERDLRSLVDF